MESLLKLLPMMIRLSGDNEEVREQAVFAAWRVAAGKGIISGCEPFRLYRKQLVIAVLDQTWKKQLEKLAGEYLFRINSLLGAPLVTFIEFREDRRHVLQAHGHAAKPFEFNHTEELTEELRASAEQIKDPELRAQFLRTAAKSLERKESEPRP
ncbi:MAG TPA: DciA family protein [Blastocatellia bacterium]|nr:DciA family protein [Blastocatellia bacterium]HMV83715.1 DciA family protein [Blastocatellia bacterium]HMX25244.1 DciA family protein [Blastocatellia bacterium]HMY72266.1 DciA family protein [Blastocatellia bacterium]HMZ19014.1 DciA family protein [Blastocatellia bacterium]